MPKGLSTKSNLARCIEYASGTLAAGIGTSLHEAKKTHGGQSPVIHSDGTFRTYMKITGNIVDYLKRHGINRLDRVTQQSIVNYFNHRINSGAAQETLKKEISASNKFFHDALGRKDLLVVNGAEIWRRGESTGAGRCFPMDRAEKVIDAMREPVNKAIATIGYNTSARIAETHKIRIDAERETVSLKGKGGKERTIDYSERPDKFLKITEAKAVIDEHLKINSWQAIREQAYSDLHRAERACGEITQGFHGFRASYIAERFEELYNQYIADGKTHEQAEKQADLKTGREAGHERPGTTRHYREA